jgi:two-component sensor histidine kinase
MKRILRSRLPERFAARVSPWVVEAGIGLATATLMTLLRVALMPWTADRAPFALVFVAVVGAAVLAGWRSGLLALIAGQLLAWLFVVDPASYAAQKATYIGGFGVATLAQLVALDIIWLYQREVDRAWARQDAQVDLLHAALREIDHRTANNYQTVLALVTAQARRADEPVRQALEQVIDRIRAIAMASKQLALSSDSLEKIRTGHHLRELCGEIRQGLSRPGVTIECQFDDIELGSDETTSLSILVNELVTNALKHAFPDGRHGIIQVAPYRTDGGLELTVADDGAGMKRSAGTRGTGLGNRLIDAFIKQLGARHDVSSGEAGTIHRVRIPLANS